MASFERKKVDSAPTSDATPTTTSYQWMLRVLGAYLDEEPSCRISMLEVPDGFVVRLQRALHKLEPEVVHFRRDTLREQLDDLMQARTTRKTIPRHQGIWYHFPNGHQDFLRALGFELDEDRACSIFLDELEDGIVLSYTCPEAPGSDTWTKKRVVLGLNEIEAILNAAFERRGKRAPAS